METVGEDKLIHVITIKYEVMYSVELYLTENLSKSTKR